jgi:hypothetical protein
MAFFSNAKYVGKNGYFNILMLNRKKFRSQTSNNTDKWKNRGGKSQRRDETRREEQKKENQRREESEERRCRRAKR